MPTFTLMAVFSQYVGAFAWKSEHRIEDWKLCHRWKTLTGNILMNNNTAEHFVANTYCIMCTFTVMAVLSQHIGASIIESEDWFEEWKWFCIQKILSGNILMHSYTAVQFADNPFLCLIACILTRHTFTLMAVFSRYRTLKSVLQTENIFNAQLHCSTLC